MKTFTRIAAVVALGLSLAACERREGPVERRAEDAGREVDRGTEGARDTADRAGERVEEAGEDAKRGAKDATD
jgi:hypothetical protein